MGDLTRRQAAAVLVSSAILSGAFGRSALACRGRSGSIFEDLDLASRHPLTHGTWSPAGFLPWTKRSSPEAICLVTNGEVQLADAFRQAKIVMLGEVHDNQEHHALRANLLNGRMIHRPSAVVFEQIRADQQPALDKFVDFNAHARRLGTAGDLLEFLDWDNSPWAKTADYRPLFEAVVNARLPIYPGDPAREVIRKVAKEGLEAALEAEERSRLVLDKPLGAAKDAASLADIEASHCGAIPKSAHPNMAAAQRYRDAYMADALLRAADAHGSAILIAGNGHVRTDRGVPWYIHQRAPERKVVSVMLVEVEEGQTDPESYVPRDPDGKPATDFIIFTPKADRTDPCLAMKAPAPK